jgi:2,4-dienoyl-CoA reductase-like NADH-dependent reductase (Old Yellow Enzyme family)
VVNIILEKLFSSGKIGKIRIKNRIVRSATFECMASKKGYITEELITFYNALAKGGSGLIITSASAIDSIYSFGSRAICFIDDSYIPGLTKLTETVHEYSDVKIAAQLAHVGRQGFHPKYEPIAPSPILYKATNRTPKELSIREIEQLIQKFRAAGRRAYEAGFDGVQLHAAHGYLLSSFLSPYTNKRTDAFGGSTEKRVRILVDIYNQLKDELGKNFPIIAKMQVIDGIPEGISLEEGIKIADILVQTGYDAIEPSGGSAELRIETNNALPSKLVKNPEDENYLSFAIDELYPIKKNCALIQVGGIRNPLSAERLLQANKCDFVSMSRPLIYEPMLPNRWFEGDITPAKCISCNSCLATIFIGHPLFCKVKRKLERKKQRANQRT